MSGVVIFGRGIGSHHGQIMDETDRHMDLREEAIRRTTIRAPLSQILLSGRSSIEKSSACCSHANPNVSATLGTDLEDE